MSKLQHPPDHSDQDQAQVSLTGESSHSTSVLGAPPPYPLPLPRLLLRRNTLKVITELHLGSHKLEIQKLCWH